MQSLHDIQTLNQVEMSSLFFAIVTTGKKWLSRSAANWF